MTALSLRPLQVFGLGALQWSGEEPRGDSDHRGSQTPALRRTWGYAPGDMHLGICTWATGRSVGEAQGGISCPQSKM